MLRFEVALLVAVAMTSAVDARVTEASATASRGLLLVANKGDHTLELIDPESGPQVARRRLPTADGA